MRCIVITTIFIGIIISQYAQSYEMNGLFPVDDKFIEISGYVSELPIEKDGRYTYIITCDGAKYKDKTYVFAMNGQTGKMTGTFPICPKRTALWFGGIWAGVTAAATLLLHLVV